MSPSPRSRRPSPASWRIAPVNRASMHMAARGLRRRGSTSQRVVNFEFAERLGCADRLAHAAEPRIVARRAREHVTIDGTRCSSTLERRGRRPGAQPARSRLYTARGPPICSALAAVPTSMK